MSTIDPLDLDAAPLLAWASRHGDRLDQHAADAVVGVLALSGARRRTGLPEPAPELVEEVLLAILPLFVSATPAQLPAFPAALVALAGFTHEAGRLNAKRRDRLIAAVGALTPRFEAAMTSPRRATWARLYGQLLRAGSVDTSDPRRVRDWLDAFACGAGRERWAALAVEAPDGFAGPGSTAEPPLAWGAFTRALIGERSRQARLLLRQRLELVAVSERMGGVDGQPLIAGVPDDEEAASAWYDEQARRLADRWTAAGLDALLTERAAELAPGLDRPAPLLDVVEELAVAHLEMFGPGVVPLPPIPVLSAADLAAAVRAAPVMASLAATAAGPGDADAPLRDLALASGFLRPGDDGAPQPGPAAGTYRAGTPGEVAGLALNVLGAMLGQMAADEQTAEEFSGDHLNTLYSLYQHAGVPQSLARQVAEEEAWLVQPDVTAAPDVTTTPGSLYQVPGTRALSELTGIPGLTEEDRAELQAVAERRAAIIDGLAALGVTSRSGDAIALTPLGLALLREALLLGTAEPSPVAGTSFPVHDDMLSWNAGQLADAAGAWPSPAARKVLGDWLAARGTAGWAELFSVLGAPPPDDLTPARRHLLPLLDLDEAPAEVLRSAISDHVLGAWAERALHRRGVPVPPADVPLSARAVLLASELTELSRTAYLTYRMTAGDPDSDPGLPAELQAAMDEAGAGWPGGAEALITTIREVAPDASALLAGPLSQHPDPAVAQAARPAHPPSQSPVSARHRAGKGGSGRAQPRKKRRGRRR